MASNGAAQSAAAQQNNQQQSEQFLQQQQQQAFANLQKYMASNPSPVSGWGQIQGPNMQGGQQIGGGTVGPNGVTSPPAQAHAAPAPAPQAPPAGPAGNSSATQAQLSPNVQAAAKSNPQLAAYLQAWQMMQAKNQTQMHGGGIGRGMNRE